MSTTEKQTLQPDTVKQYLFDTIAVAHQALKSDLDNSEEAKNLYKECAQRIEHIKPFVPKPQSKILSKYSKIYTIRSQELSESQKETVTEQRGIQNEFMNYKFKPLTEETDKTIAQLKPPSTKAHRPLWLMYALSLSISNGVHFGKDIYIPKDIWFQSGGKLYCQQAKINYCTALLKALMELQKSDVLDTPTLLHKLDTFLQLAQKEASILQKQLNHPLNYSTEPVTTLSQLGGKVFSFGKSVASTAFGLVSGNKNKEEPVKDAYIECLIRVFQRAQFFDSWLSFFQERGTNKEIEEKLEEIMDYFNSTLCAFVVHDLNVLLETWLRDSQASFVKLPPM